MEKQTTENETLNAKLRNKVTPLVTLLDILDAIDNGTFKQEQMESVRYPRLKHVGFLATIFVKNN